VIEIAAGYRADNPSPILAVFLRNIDRLAAARAAEAANGDFETSAR
jgi:LysR family hca operon transcriptional activator